MNTHLRYLSICSSCHQPFTVGRKSYHIYKSLVVMEGSLVAEWWALIPTGNPVLSTSRHSKRTDLSIIDRIDGFAMSSYITHRTPRIPQEDMTKPNKNKWNQIQYILLGTHFSLPSPHTAILLLSGDHTMSLMTPDIG